MVMICSMSHNHDTEKNAGEYDLQRMRDLFTKFEDEDNALTNSNSYDVPPSPDINLDLPLFIIESFRKLFHMWKKSVPLKDRIKPSVFDEIYKEMNSYFENDNYFDYICDTCEERIPINNGTLRYSYEMHAVSDHHQKVLDNYNYLLLYSTPASSNSEKISVTSASTNFDVNGEILPTNDGYYCKLCLKTLKNENEMISHVEDWLHGLTTIQLKPEELNDSNCIIDISNNLCCKICYIKLPKNQTAADHLCNRQHKHLNNCFKVLKKDKSIVLLNRTNFEFMCTLCGIQEFGESSKIVNHFHSKKHANAKSCSNNGESIDGKIDFVPNTKYNKIQSENENFTKYEAINDEFFLDGSQCLLCNVSVNMSQFDVHCLESKHHSTKIRVEELARNFVNDNYVVDNSPYNVEDDGNYYFCNLCLQSFNRAQLKEHESNKIHTRKFNLQKVLNSHKICISVPVENFYFCNLCEKTLRDDDSCINHCASSAHTRLFNVLQKVADI